MLAEVQRGLELLYRIETTLDVRDFVVDAATREALRVGRAPREELLVAENDGALELALFIDEHALANLAAHDPRRRLDERNLQDFLLAVEGVSHFVYVVWCAKQGRPVSALELELQAEIDKYVTCVLVLMTQAGPSASASLVSRLFERFELASDLAPEERTRYLAANSNARSYATRLHRSYVARGGVVDMLSELRWFYRLGVNEKLDHITKAA